MAHHLTAASRAGPYPARGRCRPAPSAWQGLVALVALLALTGPVSAVSLAAVGDVLLARTIPDRAAGYPPGWLWAGLGDLWSTADLRFANLEGPITDAPRPDTTPGPGARPVRFAAPPAFARQALAAGRVAVVSVANNHALDHGPAGLQETLGHLADGGLLALGVAARPERLAGPETAEPPAPALLRLTHHGDLTIGWLAWLGWDPTGAAEAPAGPEQGADGAEDVAGSDEPGPGDEGPAAEADGPGVAILDEAILAAEVAAARAACDVLVVSVHWGGEYARLPSPAQVRCGRALIDAGAALVLGHHPHVAQPVERYRHGFICYSLGNAIFDRTDPRFSNGLLARFELGSAGVADARIVALRIVDGRPIVGAEVPVVPAGSTAPGVGG